MQTVQMTLDEDLVAEVDAAVTQLGTSRSAFARDALRRALADLRERELERRHRAPVTSTIRDIPTEVLPYRRRRAG